MSGGPCPTCGAQRRAEARFCDACGAPLGPVAAQAEYKQVTVLFADVVLSMDIAAAVGPERLREIMTDLFERSSLVVERFGATVDKFTGDGIMAVFGAPVTLEDHALRACLAALELQQQVQYLGVDVAERDGVELRLRIGLNSGQVIAGEIGSGPASYTTIGEQVGMAQRMESVAPPGGVMLSESTARLVEGATLLGEPEKVHIKGADLPVIARRLIATSNERRRVRQLTTLVGRDWEMTTIAGLLEQSISGKGRVVALVGPPGIGKSRLTGETVSMASGRDVSVFTTYCQSHTSDIPFHVVADLLREVFGVSDLEYEEAQQAIRARLPKADPADVTLLEDLIGIRASDGALPAIDPDARRRRLAGLLNSAAAARTTPAVYVIEDAHWIDEFSEYMIAELAAVVGRTPSLLLITYRPEYHGLLDRLGSSHRIALAPLDDSEFGTLSSELLGQDPSVAELAAQIAERAAGNPFFAEEIVRDLAERGVVEGRPGEYVCHTGSAAVQVPASLQATIAARLDRLSSVTKRTLNACAVVGLRFDGDLLGDLVEASALDEMVQAELIDQVTYTPAAEYAFRHPLIHAVAYESQLKSDRARLHRRLVDTIKRADTVDENSALIAEHLEAAGELDDAYEWHMRAGSAAQQRDIRAAQLSWRRARLVADRLPGAHPNLTAMKIAPLMLLCGRTWRVGESALDSGFDELDELCTAAGDPLSLVVGMAGQLTTLIFERRFAEAVRMADRCSELLESIGDANLTLVLRVVEGFTSDWLR